MCACSFAGLSCVCRAQVNLKQNKLGDEGWCVIFDALRDFPQNKIAKWDLSFECVGPTVAKSLAGYMAVSTVLTAG